MSLDSAPRTTALTGNVGDPKQLGFGVLTHDAFENSKFLHCCSSCITCVQLNIFTWQNQSLVKITLEMLLMFSKAYGESHKKIFVDDMCQQDAFTVECCPCYL